MNDATKEFLEGVRDTSLRGPAVADSIRSALREVGRTMSEAYSLQVEFQEMEEREPDQEIRGALAEYSQKIGALERVGRKIREHAERYRRILRELDELESRLGEPLRETGRLPDRARPDPTANQEG